MTMPERHGNIESIEISSILKDLDVEIGTDIHMGNFDVLGWQLAAKIRDKNSDGYKNHGCLFRPNYERGILIYSLIQKKGLVNILEIGFGRGYVTACAATAIHSKGLMGSVTTVDPYHDEQKLNQFKSALNPAVANMVNITPVQKTSNDFFNDLSPDTRFDLIFIDGDHRYEAVANDYQNAIKFIDRGYIIMDDYHMPTKVDKDIDVANFVDTLSSDVDRKLVLTDRLLFNDDRGRNADSLDYGMVLLPIGDINDEQ